MHLTASRRWLLAAGAGLGATAWLPAFGQDKIGSPGLITRRIAHSGERLPVVGLGTSGVFDVGDDPTGRKACAAVLETLWQAGAN